MGIGGTYENAPRLVSTHPSSHARPGTSLAKVCCTSGVAMCAAEMAGELTATLVGGVSAVPKVEHEKGANHNDEQAPWAPQCAAVAAGADSS